MEQAMTAEQLLSEARKVLCRLSPSEAHDHAGILLIDIRSDAQRARDGVIPGAKFIQRNVLEWRFGPVVTAS